ncbi:thioredoxin H5-like [Silene latifolia]|uniref:thioredoxin H5-like n=1 Tax=Silene latifolia TaxID=37657 RepID=UPI003D77AD2C
MSSYYRREMPIQSKAIIQTPPCYKFPATQCSEFRRIKAPVGHIPSRYENRSNVVAKFSGHTANTNRVIAFHSSACWRDYFRASMMSDKLMVIYFTASWCSPCRYMAPTVDEFAAHYTDVEFDKIDVDELYNVSQELGVQAMPTFLFIRGGKEIDRVTGARREELQRKIEKHRA